MSERSAIIMPSFYEALKDLPDKDRLALYDQIAVYGLYGEVQDLPPHLKGFFALMRPNMDSARRRWEASRENGKLGGRPRKNQTENQRKNQTENLDIDTDIDTDININSNMDKDEEAERNEDGLEGARETVLTREQQFEEKRRRALALMGY